MRRGFAYGGEEVSAHNPDNLTPEQVGVSDGWRLLDEDEITDAADQIGGIEAFELGAWASNAPHGYIGNVDGITYRTRLSRAELRKARGLPEEKPDATASDTLRMRALISQRFIDRIVARAQNSMMGLGEPEKGPRSYDITKHAEPYSMESVALLLIGAHFEKYDLVSITTAALEETAEHARTLERENAQLRDALESIDLFLHPPNPNDNGRICLCSQCESRRKARAALAATKGAK